VEIQSSKTAGSANNFCQIFHFRHFLVINVYTENNVQTAGRSAAVKTRTKIPGIPGIPSCFCSCCCDFKKEQELLMLFLLKK
jgi:hypothetical protein